MLLSQKTFGFDTGTFSTVRGGTLSVLILVSDFRPAIYLLFTDENMTQKRLIKIFALLISLVIVRVKYNK